MGRHFGRYARLSFRSSIIPLVQKDLIVDLKCSKKLFRGDTLLFMVVQDPSSAASDVNHDLDLIGQ